VGSVTFPAAETLGYGFTVRTSRKLATVLVALSLFLQPLSASAAQKLGSVCKPKGVTVVVGGKKLLCTFVNGRLVWAAAPVVKGIPRARLLPSESTLLGLVDKTAKSALWAKYYGLGLAYKDAFVKQGSTFILAWRAMTPTGAPLKNTAVTLLANKGWSGSNATFTVGSRLVRKTIAGINGAQIVGRTNSNGIVRFTITDTSLQGEPSTTSVTVADQLIQENGAVYGQFALRIGKLTDNVTAMDLIDVHIIKELAQDPSAYASSLPIGRLLWSDEFLGVAGAAVDSATWTARYCGYADSNGGGACYNDESQYYLPEAVVLDGSESGTALINATHITSPPSQGTCKGSVCAFTSGRFDTLGKVAFKYGYIEARIKMPSGGGNWPAFWMLGAERMSTGSLAPGEVDITEAFGNMPRQVSGAAHYPTGLVDGSCCKLRIVHSGAVVDGADFTADYHVYAIAWLPDEIYYYVDGKRFFSVSNLTAQSTYWPFNHYFFLILNNAITYGLGFGGAYDGWAASQMSIDWVRQYELAGHGETLMGTP
jgi:beta-glucanase (GH16 family)